MIGGIRQSCADYGIYIRPINYPAVPKGTERLRIIPSPVHTDTDIDHLVGALEALWARCELARMPLAAAALPGCMD